MISDWLVPQIGRSIANRKTEFWLLLLLTRIIADQSPELGESDVKPFDLIG